MSATVRLERPEPGLALVTLNRPRVLNAIDRAMVAGLRDALRVIERDDGIAVAVFTGAGERAFCVGVDLHERQRLDDREAARFRNDELFPMYRELDALAKPSIAAIEGHAIGGGFEIALCCDLRIVSRRADFALPEVRWGMIPAGGGCAKLAATIGAARTKELVYTGARVDAETMRALGVVNRVTEPGRACDDALALAREIAAHDPGALAAAKRCIDDGVNARAADERTVALANACYASPGRRERVATFAGRAGRGPERQPER